MRTRAAFVALALGLTSADAFSIMRPWKPPVQPSVSEPLPWQPEPPKPRISTWQSGRDQQAEYKNAAEIKVLTFAVALLALAKFVVTWEGTKAGLAWIQQKKFFFGMISLLNFCGSTVLLLTLCIFNATQKFVVSNLVGDLKRFPLQSRKTLPLVFLLCRYHVGQRGICLLFNQEIADATRDSVASVCCLTKKSILTKNKSILNSNSFR